MRTRVVSLLRRRISVAATDEIRPRASQEANAASLRRVEAGSINLRAAADLSIRQVDRQIMIPICDPSPCWPATPASVARL